MNCHRGNNESKSDVKHNNFKYLLHMILCCGLPIIIVSLLPIISKVFPKISGLLGLIAPFICPLMMLSMVIMMSRGKKKNCCGNDSSKELLENGPK
ncbi:hypothetical protein [Clostridium sartagoforme]|jgi:hypothetical protein|uniref:hypothetical protein n=1 Tax=Clostridium sartagoforme TaxID=84031 RepID=UPI0031DC31B8